MKNKGGFLFLFCFVSLYCKKEGYAYTTLQVLWITKAIGDHSPSGNRHARTISPYLTKYQGERNIFRRNTISTIDWRVALFPGFPPPPGLEGGGTGFK